MTSHNAMRLTGAITALVTPFRRGEVDIAALRKLVEWQIVSGIGGLAVCTVTGEGPTLSVDERDGVISAAVRTAANRVPVLAATGTNCTASTIDLTRRAASLGAAAALVTVPYYSKPGQKGILHHFQELIASTQLPIIIVNDPARTAVGLSASTLDALSRNGSIFGLCDVGGDMAALEPLWDRLHLYTGSELTTPAFLASGGEALISTVGNVMPRLVSSLQNAASCGNLPAALTLCDRLAPLVQALGGDDPACIKYALNTLIGTPAEVRLPLVSAGEDQHEAIAAALMHLSAPEKRLLSL